MLGVLRSQGIENVMIFVCDALRWDYTPAEVMEMGLTVKTIASSLYTAPSFPSMMSGLYPPRHGVDTWHDVLSESARGLLSLTADHASLWSETTWTDWPTGESALHSVLGNPPAVSLDDIGVPFVYIEDDKGGHCPYGLPFDIFGERGCIDFFSEYGRRGVEELRRQYQRGIQESVDRFIGRLKILGRRKLIEKTLVIFTSDHGELVGEYGGLTGHGRPACSELVYVPTVFVHPSLRPGEVADSGVIRHVDLFPTVASLLHLDLPYDVDGVNLLCEQSLPKVGLSFRTGSYFRAANPLRFRYVAESVWDHHGGHVFHRQKLPRSVPHFIYRLILQTNSESAFMKQALRRKGFPGKLRSYHTSLQHFVSPYLRYGQPATDKQMAMAILDEYLENVAVLEREGCSVHIDRDVEERLRGLGYID